MALQPRLRCADRKSLLLGTALASTLLLGSTFAPAPATAQVVIIESIELDTSRDVEPAQIAININNGNNINETLVSGGSLGDLTQYIYGEQLIRITSTIDLDASSGSNPNIGILADIAADFTIANRATSIIENTYGIPGDLTQIADLSSANNPSASTAVFAKLDVTFGDDVDGIGGKAGMRVSW
jgi:hypothetical protein